MHERADEREGSDVMLLLTFLGIGGLLYAIATMVASRAAREDRLRRLEQDHAWQGSALRDALLRLAELERRVRAPFDREGFIAASEAAVAVDPLAVVGMSLEAPLAVPAVPLVEPPAPLASVAIAIAAPSSPVVLPTETGHDRDREHVVAPPVVPPIETAAREVIEEPSREPVETTPEAARVEAEVARFDWERWVGVRGAAALGACVLVIAGLYFFKYSIENDLISPLLRVVMGAVVGLGALGAAEARLRKTHVVLANWLAGAGVAILYTTFWFAQRLDVVPKPVAFGAMLAVTVTCGVLSMRSDAIVIALLGLFGGFATPAALSSHADHPFGLFGYLLVLDVALLYLAQKKRWPVLAALSLLATALYQAAWIGAVMGPERLALGIGILVVFAGVYAFASPAKREGEGEADAWSLTRVATVMLPFLFGLYFSLRADLGPRLYPLGILLVIVSAGASWVARAKGAAWASTAAAIASTTILGAWIVGHARPELAWEIALVSVAVAAVFHVFLELERAVPPSRGPQAAERAASLAGFGALAWLVAAPSIDPALGTWPWLTGWALLGVLVLRQSMLGAGAARLALAAIVGVGFVAIDARHVDVTSFPAHAVYLVALVAMTLLGAASYVVARRRPSLVDELAMLTPTAVAAYFASRGELGAHPWLIGGALLATVATSVRAGSAREASRWMVYLAPLAGLGAIAIWIRAHAALGLVTEPVLVVAALASVVPMFAEHARRTEGTSADLAPMTIVAPLAGIAVLLLGAVLAPASSSLGPWLVGFGALTAVAARAVDRASRSPHIALAIVLGSALLVVQGARMGDAGAPAPLVWTLLLVGAAVALLVASLRERAGRWATHGGATFAMILLPAVVTTWSDAAPLPFSAVELLAFGSSLALGGVVQLAAARLRAGGWSLAAVLGTAAVQALWVAMHAGTASIETLLLLALSLVVMAAAPVLAGDRLASSRMAWRASAIAGLAWSPALLYVWDASLGRRAIGGLPIAIGAVTLGVSFLGRFDERARRSALTWLLGVAVAGASLAIPLQLDNEQITVGWSILGLGLIVLWKHLDHAGLKYVGLAHLAAVVVRLVANPWLLAYHAPSPTPVLNWLAYAYWVPTACLLGAYFVMRELEAPRARPWESDLYADGRPKLGAWSAGAAVAVFFAWINLTIFDAWSSGPGIEIVFHRVPARDLTLSIAWAIYALFLLAVGMARRSAALRWTSLALIIATVGKVFLYDLSHLHDLYRVMSLVGLAMSLIVISLAYQRFVFGKGAPGWAPTPRRV